MQTRREVQSPTKIKTKSTPAMTPAMKAFLAYEESLPPLKTRPTPVDDKKVEATEKQRSK